MVITGVAIVVVPAVDLLARLMATPGWIFAFMFVLGAPVWLVVFAILIWFAFGMMRPYGAMATAARRWRVAMMVQLWLFVAGLTFFCLFMSDGGDADDWQSPAGLLLGVDGYNSRTPEYLNIAQALSVPALCVGFVALSIAVVLRVVIGSSRAESEWVSGRPEQASVG